MAPITKNDPRDLSVQISIRVPFWYREQLFDVAKGLGLTLPQLVTDALQRVHEPLRPEPAGKRSR